MNYQTTIRLISILIVQSQFLFINVSSSLKPIISTNQVQVGRLKMSPIGAGTWSWGNKFLWNYDTSQDQNLKDTYEFLIANGINWFDTADSYGTGSLTGRSESLLGEFDSQLPAAKKIKKNSLFCTKIAPFPWIIGSAAMQRSITSSSQRLKRPADILQMHWPPTLRWQEEEYIDAFVTAVNTNLARQVGLSNFGPQGLRRIYRAFQARDVPIYSNQVQFSLLSTLPLQSGLVEACLELGVQPIGYSPLALGLLTDKYTLDKLPSSTPRRILFREYLPSIEPLLGELRSIAKFRQKSVSQVALNWSLQKGFLPLVGVRDLSQAKEAIGAKGWALTAAEVLALDSSSKKIKKQLIQNANQSD